MYATQNSHSKSGASHSMPTPANGVIELDHIQNSTLCIFKDGNFSQDDLE
jgi:hypothetical protein